MNLTEFLNDDEFDADLPGGHEKDVVIPEGSRNATMSRFAGIVIKKYGDTEKAYQSFLEKAATCVPPLDNSELNTIWHSAQRFYSKISREDGYVPPEVYNDENSYKPEDFSDVGQAEVLSKYFANELRYSPATHLSDTASLLAGNRTRRTGRRSWTYSQAAHRSQSKYDGGSAEAQKLRSAGNP